MRLIKTGIFAALGLCCLTAGCQNKLRDENEKLWGQNRELQKSLDEKNRTPAQPVGMMPVTSQPRVEMPPRQPELVAPEPTITGVETKYNPSAGTMTVNLASDVTFDSGQAMIKPQGKTVLDKVADGLKGKYAGKQVRVEGHTDSDPIKHSRWKDNQALSEARANAVREYLVSKGVDAGKVSTRGFGDTRPKGSDKAANRRVEIVVLVNAGTGASDGGMDRGSGSVGGSGSSMSK